MGATVRIISILLMMLFMAFPAYAGSGHAAVPFLNATYSNANSWVCSAIVVSNITDHIISGRVKIYDRDGNVFTDNGSASNGNLVSSFFASYSEETVSGNDSSTFSFTLNPHSTAKFSLNMSSLPGVSFHGYAVISWENVTGDDIYGLIANGVRIQVLTDARCEHSIPVNSGMPF